MVVAWHQPCYDQSTELVGIVIFSVRRYLGRDVTLIFRRGFGWRHQGVFGYLLSSFVPDF